MVTENNEEKLNNKILNVLKPDVNYSRSKKRTLAPDPLELAREQVLNQVMEHIDDHINPEQTKTKVKQAIKMFADTSVNNFFEEFARHQPQNPEQLRTNGYSDAEIKSIMANNAGYFIGVLDIISEKFGFLIKDKALLAEFRKKGFDTFERQKEFFETVLDLRNLQQAISNKILDDGLVKDFVDMAEGKLNSRSFNTKVGNNMKKISKNFWKDFKEFIVQKHNQNRYDRWAFIGICYFQLFGFMQSMFVMSLRPNTHVPNLSKLSNDSPPTAFIPS